MSSASRFSYSIQSIALFLLVLSHCHNAFAGTVTLPEADLLSSEFASTAFGPASVVRSNISGPAVRFSFTGLTGSGTGMKDDYPVSDIGQVIPSHGNGDFSIFDGYGLTITNSSLSGSVWCQSVYQHRLHRTKWYSIKRFD